MEKEFPPVPVLEIKKTHIIAGLFGLVLLILFFYFLGFWKTTLLYVFLGKCLYVIYKEDSRLFCPECGHNLNTEFRGGRVFCRKHQKYID